MFRRPRRAQQGAAQVLERLSDVSGQGDVGVKRGTLRAGARAEYRKSTRAAGLPDGDRLSVECSRVLAAEPAPGERGTCYNVAS
jgi:hypothetical protein